MGRNAFRQSLKNSMRREAVSSYFKALKEVTSKGELAMTPSQIHIWSEIDDEYLKHDLKEISREEGEKLIERSRANAIKRKNMGYASTAQLRYLHSLSGEKPDRMMKSKDAAAEINKLKRK